MAASDRFMIRIQGRGGHAAAPHTTLDPVVAASTAVLALQHLVSRGTDPQQGGVVSVSRFNTGGMFLAVCSWQRAVLSSPAQQRSSGWLKAARWQPACCLALDAAVMWQGRKGWLLWLAR